VSQRTPNAAIIVAGAIILTVIGLMLAFYGTIAYVVVHFVKKHW
jgi:hypothetical protein